MARHLQGHFGGQILSFAAPIKRMIAVGFNIPENSPYWDEAKEQPIPWLGKSMRHLMQTLGTEWGRTFVDANLWTLLLERAMIPNIVPVIVPDVRFDNEQHWVLKRGGILLGVNRPGASGDKHASESVDFSRCAHVVQNDGSLSEYEARCYEVFDHVLKTRK
jgi:hypothetical protein